jgi:hypothetical protein
VLGTNTQPPSAPSHVVLSSQKFTRSSTLTGSSVHFPFEPGTAHDVQVAQELLAQHTDSTHALVLQSVGLAHPFP